MKKSIKLMLHEQSNADLNKISKTISTVRLMRRQKLVVPSKYWENAEC
jgi:hypothetical protein